jgi:hypothetical protein
MWKRAKGTATAALQPGDSEPRHIIDSEPRLIRKATGKARSAKKAKRGWRPSSPFQPAVAARSAKMWMVPRVARLAAGSAMASTRARMSRFFAPDTINRIRTRLKRRIGERDARLGHYPKYRCHPGVALVERLGSRKQRSGVTVLAEAEQVTSNNGRSGSSVLLP